MKIALGFMRHDENQILQSQQLVDFAISNGVNTFETCPFYLNNNCENFVYNLLQAYSRESYEIIGKLPIKNFVTNYNFQEVFEKQIQKVPGHYFDIYEIQAIDDTCLYDLMELKIIPFLLKKKKDGFIKKFGLNIQCDPDTLDQMLNLKCFDILQMPLNIYDWNFCLADQNYRIAMKYNIPIIAQAPLKGGSLKDDIGNAYSFFKDLNVEYVLCGNTNINSFKDTLNYIRNPQSYIKKDIQISEIKCLNCRRCYLACPQHIPVGFIFNLYNKSLKDKSSFLQFAKYKSFTGEPSHNCTFCGQCEIVCPQSLNIMELLQNQIFELRL